MSDRLKNLAERIVAAHGGYMVPPHRRTASDNKTRDELRDAVVSILREDKVIAAAIDLVEAHHTAVAAHDQSDDDVYREAYVRLDAARKAVGNAAMNEALSRPRGGRKV